MDGWFLNPRLFDHLQSCKTRAMGTVIPNRRELPKENVLAKLEKGEQILWQQKQHLTIKWTDTQDVYV
jgi:hypothetical protein